MSPPSPGPRAALTRELSELLIEISIAVHRFAMYPPGHPSLEPVVASVVGRLAANFRNHDSLSLGVAQRQLVIEGVATDPRHPVLSDLARRLHNHQLGAVRFDRGAGTGEIVGLLAALAGDPERDARPLGEAAAEASRGWEHVALFPVGYDRLSLGGEGDEGGEGGAGGAAGRATELWLGLAQAALAGAGPLDGVPGADLVARGIVDHGPGAAYEQVVVGYMAQLAEELREGEGGPGVEEVRGRLSSLIGELDDDTLARLVHVGGSLERRKRFVLDASEAVAVDAVVKILQAAATASQQSISTSMTRLLGKLAIHAEQGPGRVREQADAALRENVESLMEGWELEDPNPDAYTLVLDGMARAAPVFHASGDGDGDQPGAERLVEMALEVDAWGATVRKAIHDLLRDGKVAYLLDLLERAPEDSALAGRIRRHMMSPEQLRILLGGEDIDEDALTALVEGMGSAAVEPLLDVLAESDALAVRRKVFDQLAGMGPFVAKRTVERLEDPRWFVQRNMLALLQRIGTLPPELDLGRFLAHADARVRREAFPLALLVPEVRDRGLAAALADDDERMVRMALLALQKDAPETLVPSLVSRVVKQERRSADLRAMGARALRHSRSSLALETLLGLASAGRTLLGKARLADPSAPMLAALRTLAEVWRDDPRAAALLGAATRSRDPEVRAAAEVDAP